MSTLQIGELFNNRYLITRSLGAGGMGSVFAAQDKQRADLPCAIKVLHTQNQEDEHSIKRLSQERIMMSKLKHQHIVEIFDVVATSQSQKHYIVMPLLKGKTLNNWIKQQHDLNQTVNVNDFMKLICQILDALDYAHAMSIIHRDLKPDNIFVCEGDYAPTIKILDFGIAKDLEDHANLTSEMQNAMIGTPRYMSPEQIHNQPVSPQSDLYTLTLIIYEYLSGHHPFETPELKETSPMKGLPSALQMSWHHLHSTPTPLKALPSLWALLESTIHKKPTERLASARIMRNHIKDWLKTHSKARSFPIPIDESYYAVHDSLDDEFHNNSTDFHITSPHLSPDPSQPNLGFQHIYSPRSESVNLLDLRVNDRATTNDQNDISKQTQKLKGSKRKSWKLYLIITFAFLWHFILKKLILAILGIIILAWAWKHSGKPEIPYFDVYFTPLFELFTPFF
jgi:serine/threonine protein kinase